MAQWLNFAFLLLSAVLLGSIQLAVSADWSLVVAHSNDLWFQLDEITSDDRPCYKDLPPTTTATSTDTSPTTQSSITSISPTTESSSISTSPSSETSSTVSSSTSPTTSSSETLTQTSTPATSTPATFTSPTTVTATSTSTTASPTTVTATSTSKTASPTTVTATSTSTTASPTTVTATSTSTTTASPTTVTATSTPTPITSPTESATSTPTTSPLTTVSSASSASTDSTTTVKKLRASDDFPCYGGVARHLSKKQELKEQYEKEGKAFVHLSAGGILGGIIWFPILGPGPAVEAIKMLGYDAVALGYRDFDEGIPTAIKYLQGLNNTGVPVVCANINVKNEPGMERLFQPSVIIEKNGKKIGIIGYLGKDAEFLADTGKITFEDEYEAIQRETKTLKEKGVSFIIALGNVGYDQAKILMDKNPDVDLFVNGGGKSVFQFNGDGPLNEKPVDRYPFQRQQRYLVTTSRYGKYLGKLDMTITEDGKISKINTTSTPILLDNQVKPDPTLQGMVDDWERTVLTKSNEEIGYTKLPIESNRTICWYRECTGASIMADAVRWFLEKNETQNTIAATIWHGGALSSTFGGVMPGKMIFGDILAMFPFANTLATVDITGADIRKMFEASVEFYNDASTTNQGEFLHVSGITVEYDLRKEKLKRVYNIMIRDTNSLNIGYSKLNDEATYRIAMPSFIAKGGSRYSFLEKYTPNITEIRDEVALQAFTKQASPLSYMNEGRIRFVTPEASVDVTGTVFLTIFLTLLFSGLIYAAYKYLYPKLRDRRGSLLSLVR